MIAIFKNQTALDEMRPKLPSGVTIGTPIQGADGRVAIGHPFIAEDQQEILANGGQLFETLPSDWQYPTETIQLSK